MLSPFFQPRYSTVLDENLITYSHFSSDVQYSSLQSYNYKMGIFAILLYSSTVQ